MEHRIRSPNRSLPDIPSSIRGLYRRLGTGGGTAGSFNNLDENPRPGTSRSTAISMPRGLTKKKLAEMYKKSLRARAAAEAAQASENANANAVRNPDVQGSGSDSDSQSSDDSFAKRHFFRDIRVPYTLAEDEEILKFILLGNNMDKTSSILLWKELEVIKNKPKRTYQSMKNRFMRNIKPYVLTKFRHLLTPDEIRTWKRKYPNTRGSGSDDGSSVSKSSGRFAARRIICINPSDANSPKRYYADSRYGMIELTEGEVLDKYESVTYAARDHGRIKEYKEVAVGCDFPVPQGSQTSATNFWVEPVPSTSQVETAVNIFSREKLTNVPVQSFKYHQTIQWFSNKAVLNVKLVLDRNDAANLPANLPVTVNVTIGRETDESTKEKGNTAVSNDKENLSKKEKIKKKRDALKRLRKATESMLYKVELEKIMEDIKSTAEAYSSDSESDMEESAEEKSPIDNSQNTNCSTEDESCYTQTLKKVSHTYKVEVRPTQSLIEDQSEESILVKSSPTPPPVGNPQETDKGTLKADTIKFRGSSPSGCSLNQSGKNEINTCIHLENVAIKKEPEEEPEAELEDLMEY